MNSFSIGHAPGLFFARAAIDGAHQRVMPTLSILAASQITSHACRVAESDYRRPKGLACPSDHSLGSPPAMVETVLWNEAVAAV